MALLSPWTSRKHAEAALPRGTAEGLGTRSLSLVAQAPSAETPAARPYPTPRPPTAPPGGRPPAGPASAAAERSAGRRKPRLGLGRRCAAVSPLTQRPSHVKQDRFALPVRFSQRCFENQQDVLHFVNPQGFLPNKWLSGLFWCRFCAPFENIRK